MTTNKNEAGAIAPQPAATHEALNMQEFQFIPTGKTQADNLYQRFDKLIMDYHFLYEKTTMANVLSIHSFVDDLHLLVSLRNMFKIE